ncbi:MAG TPA: hypothetical protein DCL61_10130 [Cyanobacteria bacterium UBA12227]|nr:hypothetical protein [Cyanobacteria bacterium UBA12227]HAX88459.1 hypothetical protein [Cyanobacteria bacterium UBA11370]HBY75623.1 hypothetical protein [Cyanobacteria bacterium UBA11148]
MFKLIFTVSASLIGVLTITSLPIYAQTNSSQPQFGLMRNIELNGAKNLARQTAERLNGGLGSYRAESAMHGPPSQAPYVDNGNGTWAFTFLGSQPGSATPTIETVVTVARDSRQVTVDYNGPIRSTAQQ